MTSATTRNLFTDLGLFLAVYSAMGVIWWKIRKKK